MVILILFLLDQILEKNKLQSSGYYDESIGVVEDKDHPWLLGCHYHPELLSRPNRPHPLFVSFIKAALKK